MVAHGKLVLAMLFSPVSADLLYHQACGCSASPSARPDNLCASTAPVSRGQIGRAAASYVLAVQESIPQARTIWRAE